MKTRKQGVVIVGGGPAGFAPLVAAAAAGRLQELLDVGVTIVEKGAVLGSGGIRNYAIRSDSSAEAILDIVYRASDPVLQELRSHPLVKTIGPFNKGSVQLSLVAEFLELVASAICEAVRRSAKGKVFTGATAIHARQTPLGDWITKIRDADGRERDIESFAVVLATGAHQPSSRLLTGEVAGTPLLPRFAEKLLQSGEVLSHGGVGMVRRFLEGKNEPKVVIVGGSSSAAAVALTLLNSTREMTFGRAGVTIMHRGPLRIFYESAQEAVADGYEDFRDSDVCRLTGRVYRLAGFRLDYRELMMRAQKIGKLPEEPRIDLFPLNDANHDEANQRLAAADLVIAALGYRPEALPVFDSSLVPIKLANPSGTRWAIVDQQCNLLSDQGTAIGGIYALGLAVGPHASSELGGELGFTGQVNSLWLWQHSLGLRVVEGVLASAAAHPATADLGTGAIPRHLQTHL